VLKRYLPLHTKHDPVSEDANPAVGVLGEFFVLHGQCKACIAAIYQAQDETAALAAMDTVIERCAISFYLCFLSLLFCLF
jgi:hypothetical protein